MSNICGSLREGENPMGQIFWDSGTGHLFGAISLIPKVSEAAEKLLLVPTPQSSLTNKVQVSKISSESSALIKNLLTVVIVRGYKKKDDWCLLTCTGMHVLLRR